MICKECGAYNPDHATYCKVCAANLKDEPEAEAPVVSEEDSQPTKRFSRPSWIVPGQSKETEDVISETAEEITDRVDDTVEKAVSDAEETVNDVEEKVLDDVKEAEETVEEETRFAWTPVPGRNASVQNEEPSEPEASDAEAPEEDFYNDEEALGEEEESFEYEPTPPKRKQAKKKQSTLFTVLLIAIIVVIIGALVAFGLWFLKNKGVLKCDNQATDADTSSSRPVDPDNTDPNPGATNTPAPAGLDEKNAELIETVDEDGIERVHITVMIPSNGTVTIAFPNQPDYTWTNTEDKTVPRKVKIPVEVFYPGTPLEQETMTFTPDVKITTAEGTEYKINCPSFTRTFPKLNITVSAPVADENGMIMAPESNTISIQGTIDDPNPTLLVNGKQETVYSGGVFMFDYSMSPDATEDTEETVTIVASKANCVSDTKEITIHAYKFVPEPMTLEVKSDLASLRADKSGKLIVTGKTLPGATLTAASDNSTNVLCGSVTVDGDGNFSFQVTMDPSFYGLSVITLDATKEGCEDGSVKFTVMRGLADKNEFVKHYLKTKTYREVKEKGENAISIAELLANPAQYAGSTYGIRITATVVETNTVGDDTIVKMTIAKTNEVVYVHALSTVWQHNVGSMYNVYCNFIGSFEDTGCAEFYGWFAKNK